MPNPARSQVSIPPAASLAMIGLRNALLLSLPIWLAITVVLALL